MSEPRLYLSAAVSEHTTAGGRVGAPRSTTVNHLPRIAICKPTPTSTHNTRTAIALGHPSATFTPILPPLARPPLPADSGIANKLIDAAVAQYVLPLMPALFADEDPMPL